MPTSVISGDDVPPDDETHLRVKFPDGETRQVIVSKKEATSLKSKGEDLSPWYIDVTPNVLHGGAWLLGLALTVLVLPALTKQWADRPKELETKSAMAIAMSESVAGAVEIARLIVARDLPESVIARRTCDEAEESGLAGDAKACSKKTEIELVAVVTRFNEVRNDWNTTAASLEANAQAYFPTGELANDIKVYASVVTMYLRLASETCGSTRDDSTDRILGYLGEQHDDWTPLFQLTEQECKDKLGVNNYLGAYRALGDQVLEARWLLLRRLTTQNPEGFSSGFHDFFDDASGPIVVVLVVALLFLFVFHQIVVARAP